MNRMREQLLSMGQRGRGAARPRWASLKTLVVLLAPMALLAALVWNLLAPVGTGGGLSAATGTSVAVVPVERRAPAPDFSVATVDGSIFRLSDHPGDVRLLFFTGVG